MQLSEWIKATTTDEQRKLAKMCGCASNYLYYVALNGCSPGLAKKIEKATAILTPEKVVYRWELRGDIWEKPKNNSEKT